MAFSSDGKLDQHMKFSPMHAANVARSAPHQGTPPANNAMPSITVYSGAKLFWRSGLNVELIMQWHEQANVVQVRDTHGSGAEIVVERASNGRLGGEIG